MPVHSLIYCMLAFCWPLPGPFCLLLPVLLCQIFGTLRPLLRPCGHVWGLTMRKCAPCGLERACSSFSVLMLHRHSSSVSSVSCGTMFHALPFNCRASSSLSVLHGWGMVFRLVPRWVALWFVALCFRPFPLFGSFTSTLSLSVSPVSLSMIV